MTAPALLPAALPDISDLEQNGFALVPGVLDADATYVLAETVEVAIEEANQGGAKQRRGGSVGGVRNVLALSVVQTFLQTAVLRDMVQAVLGAGAFAVRGILFDKTPEANWKVPYHQDLAVPVREKRDLPGWGGWSVKAGVVHGQPPASVLENMLTTRLHLDPCPQENGPLRVLPGTYRQGRLTEAQTSEQRQSVHEIVCAAGVGDVLLMRPLLLHASSPAEIPARRRILHIEWAAKPLPGGLEWADTV